MINKIKEWSGVIALVAIVLILLGVSPQKMYGTINGTDITATRYTQLLVDNGIQVTANGINIVAGGFTNTAGTQSNGGVSTAVVRQSALNSATTTPCAIQNPLGATSTVQTSINITTATSSIGNFIAAVATSPNATTSVITQGIAIAANAFGTLSSNGISTSTGATTVVGPSQYIVWGMTPGSAASYGYYTYGGTCNATFTAVN